MLSLPFHRQHLRGVAFMMLSAWVMALLAGVVNGCLVQPELRHAPMSVVSIGLGVSEPVVRAFHVEPGDHDSRAGHTGDTPNAGQATCLKFCDNESSTVAKSKTAQTDLSSIAVATRVNGYAVVPATAVALHRSVERSGSQGPSLVIRFLRLTI